MIKFNRNNKNKTQTRQKYNRPDLEQQKQKSQSLYTKYMTLGKEALAQGDSIEAERNFQYAEHYIRLVNLAIEQTPKKQPPIDSTIPESAEENLSQYPEEISQNLNLSEANSLKKTDIISSKKSSKKKSEKSPVNPSEKEDISKGSTSTKKKKSIQKKPLSSNESKIEG